MKRPLRFGVLGCADIALRRVMPALHAEPATEVRAVAARDPERAATAARPYDAAPVHGYQALLERDDIDAVYVPLPAALHAEWNEAVLRSGRHLLAEKPMTTDPASTRELLDLAEKSGLGLMENVMFVHHGLHSTVRGLLRDGAIGGFRSLHAAFGIPRLPDHDIRHDPDLGGGALNDVGIYPLRLALHLLGEDLEVLGAHLGRSPGDRVETSGAALLRISGGGTAQVAFGMDHGYRSAFDVWGSTGRISVNRAYTPPPDLSPVIRLHHRDGHTDIRVPAENQARATVAAFAASVRSGTGAAYDRHTPAVQAALLEAVRAHASQETERTK